MIGRLNHVAIVVPDSETVVPWAAKKGIPAASSLKSLCKNDQVKQLILDDMKSLGKASGLNGIEIVQAIYLEPNPFTVENDLLTPTFKLKRQALKKNYQDVINEMYAELAKANSRK